MTGESTASTASTESGESGESGAVTGEWRSPAQMLDDQHYDGHVSVHDAAAAASLGLAGAPIEGPTHFSQFDPLAVQVWGDDWFRHGCISAHFQTMVVAGEEVQATLTPTGARTARIEAAKRDGSTVLMGTASVGPDHPPTELEQRLARSREPGELFIVDRLAVGQRSSDGDVVTMTAHDSNGNLYPFSLAQKLQHITESSPYYGTDSPWGAAVVPMEMISVLAMKSGSSFAVRGPALGLFLDLEIRLLDGPVLVGRRYVIGREVVGLSQSRKTESYWMRTTLTDADTDTPVASVLLHSGVFKASYAAYPQDRL